MKKSKYALLGLAAVVLLVIAIEAVFGAWITGPQFGALNVGINSSRTMTGNPFYPPGAKTIYKRDQYGLRGNYGTPQKVSILVIGGSPTNDRASDEGDTWTDILQATLQKNGSRQWVANAGVDGHSTIGHINSFERWFSQIPGLKPKYVLLYIGANDINVTDTQYLPSDNLVSPELSRRITTYLNNHSFLTSLARNLRGRIPRRSSDAQNLGDFQKPDLEFVPFPKLEKPVSTKGYTDRLQKLHAAITAIGAKPIFVSHTSGLIKEINGAYYAVKDSGADAVSLRLKPYNSATMAFCRSVQGICIDLAATLKLGTGDFYDVMHTTPSGSRKIGEFLAHELTPLLK